MARVMKLDEIADDVGLDVNGDALLARGEQLVKLEVCFDFSLLIKFEERGTEHLGEISHNCFWP